MGVNVNGNEIKKVIFDSNVKSNFLKRKDGKNDRVAMLKGLEHGHKYYVTLTVIYADWTEYETTLTLEKLVENRTMVQVSDSNRFGSFVLNFDTLLKDELKKGEFVQELQVQSDKYFKLISEWNEKIAKANKETDEQKNIVKKYSLENSVLKADKVLLETQVENQLMVIEQQKNEITVANKFKNNFNKLGRLFFRVLLRKAITMYNSGKTIDEVVDYVMEKFNDELNNKN
jgi:hypothetical protein